MEDFPTTGQITALKAYRALWCVSIYIPSHEPTVPNQNRIELKNVLRRARIALLDAGLPERKLRKTLRPGHQLLHDDAFWLQHRHGLALFMHADFFRSFTLPAADLPLQLTIEQGFNVAPLLQILSRNRQYFILTLGHKDVRLYKGDRFTLRPVTLKHFPADMRNALRLDEEPKWRQTHTIAPASRANRSEAVHGQYNVSQVDKQELTAFFRLIDQRLHSYLRTRTDPLILAGAGYLQPLYRQINTYPHLWSAGIRGSANALSRQQLRDKAWALMSAETPAKETQSQG